MKIVIRFLVQAVPAGTYYSVYYAPGIMVGRVRWSPNQKDALRFETPDAAQVIADAWGGCRVLQIETRVGDDVPA